MLREASRLQCSVVRIWSAFGPASAGGAPACVADTREDTSGVQHHRVSLGAVRKVVVQEFVTLDGFAAGPNGELDFMQGDSTADPTSGPFVEDQLAFISTLDTILLGAVTYRMFSGSGRSRQSRRRGSPTR